MNSPLHGTFPLLQSDLLFSYIHHIQWGTNMSTYGKRLKQERLRLCLTQKQLGRIGGVSRQSQSMYERDVSLPFAPYLAALALLGVDVLYIITGRHSLKIGSPVTRSDTDGEFKTTPKTRYRSSDGV